MSLDNDFDYRTKVRDTQQLLMAAVQEQNDDVHALVDTLREVDTTAFSGGYNERQYEQGKELVETLRKALADGVLACDTTKMETALNRVEQLLDHYKATNSFDAKADDRTVDVDGGLSF